ncbi:MAG: VWA domain-containing protein [Holophagales bacterium]|nr:VWA domain-containing protein [Holophagales bacterium]
MEPRLESAARSRARDGGWPLPGWPPAALVFAVCACVMLSTKVDGASDGPDLDAFYGEWLRSVEPWIEGGGLGRAEREVFESLRTDEERELFVYGFWRARGLGKDGLGAGLDIGPDADRTLVDWWYRFGEVRRRLGGFEGVRARAMLTIDVPDRVLVYGGCRGVLRPLRIWHYDRHQAAALLGEDRPEGFYLVFARDYEATDGLFRAWHPSEGLGALTENDAPHTRRSVEQILAYSRDRRCFRTGEREAPVVAEALRSALGAHDLGKRLASVPASAGWLEELRTRLERRQARLPIERVAVGYPGHDAAKALMLGRIEAPAELVRRGAAGQLFDRWVLSGDILLGRHTVDSFEHVYHLAGAPPVSGRIALDLYRRLRPTGETPYTLRLRLADARGLALLRRDLSLRVPAAEGPKLDAGSRPAGVRKNVADLTRRDVVRLLTFPSLELVHPGDSLVGEVEVEALATGGPIGRVELRLDGRSVATDTGAPYRAVIDLGPEPAHHELEAVAYGPDGSELARDRLHLDPAVRPFTVDLVVEPTAEGATREDGTEARKAHIVPTIPEGESLEGVRLLLDGALLGERSEPPFRFPLPSPLPPGPGYLRAVATLRSGARAEDLAFLGRHHLGEAVDVRLIEVFTTVVDGSGRPITGLGAEDFRLLENGELQPLERFDAVSDLPIQVVLVMDTSVSMRGRLALAAASARRFFSTVVTEKDAAALVVFDHDIRLAVPFTADHERLHLGTSGLDARGGTRLGDSLVFAANYFGGREGRRALVVLSDGRDVGSTHDFVAVEERVTRAGVAVYPILLAVDDEATRRGLGAVAEASGGRAFSIRSAAELDGVYARIEEELRSQYLLVFQSPEGSADFRRLEVHCRSPELRCRSIRGYYPPASSPSREGT